MINEMLKTSICNLKLATLKEIISLATETLENIHGYKIPWVINNKGKRFYGKIFKHAQDDENKNFVRIEYVLSSMMDKTVYKLLETIAHEHAHTSYWGHISGHELLKQRYLDCIINEVGHKIIILCKEQVSINSVAEKIMKANKIEGKKVPNYKNIFGNNKINKKVYLELNSDEDGYLRIKVKDSVINIIVKDGINNSIARAIAYYIREHKECKTNLIFCFVNNNKIERILVKNIDKGFKFL